ncbi:MAG TPA: hypothetical protein VMW01_07965 [Williamwhitmania sp.]|jgi:hypothetical protein|nr:hypothetical protein [Williamwhitmania sp.]
MKKRFSGEEELEKVVEGFPKGNPYKVPEGYFNEFPRRLKEQLSQPSFIEVTHRPSRRFIYTQLAYAAGFALLISLGYLGLRMMEPTKVTQPVAKVTAVRENGVYIDFDEASLIDALQNDHNQVKTTVTDNATKDAMIQYLVEDNVDYTTLVEKY